MTDLITRKKKRITITASSEGVEIAENALIRLGFDSKSNFAKTHFLARSTVTNFFQCQPIQLDSFKKICQELKLDWRKIAGLSEEKQSQQLEIINDCDRPDINEGGEPMLLTQTLRRQVTVIDKDNQEIKAVVILKGEINSGVNFQALESILRIYSGDTVKIIDIKEGSIKLFVEGSQENIYRLVSRIKSGELKEVSGFPVEDVQILSESSEDDESNELNNKWCLVREIVTQGIRDRNLTGVDLSDADLSDADLSRANLSRADLRGTDLSDADLSDANLSGANLRGADLSRAYLSRAYLSGTDLSGANLSRANLSRADLSGADLTGANLTGANLTGANLTGANLTGANLTGAKLLIANLSGADLSGADLSRAYLSRAYLRNTAINDKTKLDHKWRLVQEIVTHGLRGRDLSGADLSRANLSGANLSDANLSDAYLSDANLSGANLSGANLSGANLSGANLSGANLSRTKVEKAQFRANLGISESMKQDLIKQGAIFEDSPGDRSEVLTKA
jgi:uncharacterized protein YjbI with pentapeptide repeats